MDTVVVPALPVHAVDAVELNTSRLEAVGQGSNRASVLVLVEPAHRGWKDQHGSACMAKLEEFHVPTQAGTVPAMVFPSHRRTCQERVTRLTARLAPELR